MLTKEECLEIIDFLDFFYGENLINTAELRKKKPKKIQEEDIKDFKNKLEKLSILIHERFDNPPLKFEELEKGREYWDNDMDRWVFISDLNKDFKNGHYLCFEEKNDEVYEIPFIYKENRFYRYEVKEDVD